MRFHISIASLFLFFSFFGKAQEVFTLTDEEVKVPWFGKEEFTHTLFYKDKLVINLWKKSNLPIHMLEVRRIDNDSVIARYMRPQSLVEQVIPIDYPGDYNVILKNYAPIKRKVQLNIKRIPKVPVYYYRDSLAIDTIITMREIKTPVKDTIPETLLEADIEVNATMNILVPSRTCIELPVPEQANYYWAYWMSANRSIDRSFEKLGEDPPLSWQRKTIDDPLMAYGLDLTDTLPEKPTVDDWSAFLTDAYGSKEFQNGLGTVPYNEKGPRGFLSNYGKVEWNQEMLNFPVFVCFENRNRVSPVLVTLKTIGFIISTRIDITEIERTEITQEIIKIKVIPPDPGPSPAPEGK